MKALALLLCAWVLAGCGLVYSWSRPHSGPQAFANDKRECLHEGRYMHRDGFGNVYSMTDPSIYRACMEAKGWERRIGGDFR